MTKALNSKDKRGLMFAAKRLFSEKSLFTPSSIDDFRSIPSEKLFSHVLHLTNNREIFLTDSGYEHFRNIVEILDRANYFEGAATYSDISNAWRKVVPNWLSSNLMPEHADEVIEAINLLVSQEVDDITFIVPIFGVDLEQVDSFTLGAMSVLRMSEDVLNTAGVDHSHVDISRETEYYKDCLWLKGTMHGTPKAALQKFSEQAALTVGILAVSAASKYENGAHGFRFGTVMSPETANGRSVWFSWPKSTPFLHTHYKFPRGQAFPIDSVFKDDPDWARMIFRGIVISQSNTRTELEEAIARALYWYSDAQQDPVFVMKLIKYWSCVEAFFSFDNEEITHAVSVGLSSILVFGGFGFVPPSEYDALKKKISILYSARSRAVHRGSHHHATELDVAQFSQWVAWMIINMIVLTEQGYTKLQEIKVLTERLDALSAQLPE